MRKRASSIHVLTSLGVPLPRGLCDGVLRGDTRLGDKTAMQLYTNIMIDVAKLHDERVGMGFPGDGVGKSKGAGHEGDNPTGKAKGKGNYGQRTGRHRQRQGKCERVASLGCQQDLWLGIPHKQRHRRAQWRKSEQVQRQGPEVGQRHLVEHDSVKRRVVPRRTTHTSLATCTDKSTTSTLGIERWNARRLMTSSCLRLTSSPAFTDDTGSSVDVLHRWLTWLAPSRLLRRN